MAKINILDTAKELDARTKLLFERIKQCQADLGDKLSYVWNTAVDTVRMVRLSFQMLFSGKAGLSDLSGPVGIVSQMSQVAESSETTLLAAMNLLSFGAFIAINLAVMNLLPIPALDGGRVAALLLTTAIEGITHKKLNPSTRAMSTQRVWFCCWV